MSIEAYTIHDGILMSRICGRFFLIAVRAAWNECPHMKEVNEYGAFCWRQFEAGRNTGEIVKNIVEEYHVTEEEARSGLAQFVEQLRSFHYLVPL